jgi:phosphate starvation-inducible protein PhoH
MQNSTPNQMKMLLTRLGEGSKVVVTGDIQQNDISASKENGLLDIVTKTKKYTSLMSRKHNVDVESLNSVQIIEFDNKHIERSKVVRRILDIYAIDTILEKYNSTLKKSPPGNNDAAMIPKDEDKVFREWSEREI